MSKNLALVFPGQGSQSLKMMHEFYDLNKIIQTTFTEASNILDCDLWEIAQTDANNRLNQTAYTQPLILTASIALWRLWQQSTNVRPSYLAGHSLGEYCSLVVAGALNFNDAVKLVHVRGLAMQQAVPEGNGAMAAILGLNDEQVINACAQAAQNEIVSAVNFNAPGQVVIAGNCAAVQRAIILCKEQGARKAMELPVSVPSHCALMNNAAKQLAGHIDIIEWQIPQIAVMQNVNAQIADDITQIKNNLIAQLYSPVKWTDTINNLANLGVSQIIECGPGKVLTGLNKRINKQLTNYNLDPIAEFNKTLNIFNN